jgi:eukaryotic-like serine/threonine-protein kinase
MAALLAGRYRLQTKLSATTMAEVWLADDAELQRQVVVKLLARGADPGRFEREARAVAALADPHIVRLFDFGDDRRPYMIFEYLTGGSLEDRLAAARTLPNAEVERIARGVAQGLAHAHQQGVVHRDLKPGNILFDAEGRAKVADFGIARVQGTDTLTDAGTILGTVSYMSPEQVRGEPATSASDVYSFGVILYRLLAGRLPFEAESPMELAVLHRDAVPPPLGTVENTRLAAVAMSALAKEPADRPADGSALVGQLEGTGFADAGTTRILATPRRAARRLPLLAGFAVALVAGAGVLAAVLLTRGPASAPAVPPQSSPATHHSTPSAPPRTAASTRETQTATQPRTTAPTVSTHPVTTTTTPPTEPSTQLTTEPTDTIATTTTVAP